jgi:thiol:disulfide interchange protein
MVGFIISIPLILLIVTGLFTIASKKDDGSVKNFLLVLFLVIIMALCFALL